MSNGKLDVKACARNERDTVPQRRQMRFELTRAEVNVWLRCFQGHRTGTHLPVHGDQHIEQIDRLCTGIAFDTSQND